MACFLDLSLVATNERKLPMDRHCGHCGKTLENVSLSRFYFEDDSWLCVECFGTRKARRHMAIRAFPTRHLRPGRHVSPSDPFFDRL